MHAACPQLVGKCNRVAVEIEHQGRQTLGTDRGQAEAAHKDKSGQGMGRFEFTVNDFVANGRPTDLAAELDSQVVFFEQSKLARHDDRRTVVERHKANAQWAGAAARAVFRI